MLNKIDLVSRRSDLLELARVLTNGRVAGKSIQTQEKIVSLITPGKIRILPLTFARSYSQIGRLGTTSRGMTLHDESVKENDEAWREKFRYTFDLISGSVRISTPI